MSDIYLQITETPTVVTLSAPVVSGALASTVTVANTVTVALDSNSLSALENVTVTVGAAITGTVTVSNFPATQPVSIASVTIGNTVTIAGTVTANPTGTQTIAGTVTASNLGAVLDQYEVNAQEKSFAVVASLNVQGYLSDSAKSHITNSVTIGSLPALVAGTAQIGSVTASISNSVTIASLPAISGTVTASISNSVTIASFATSVTARLINPAGTAVTYAEVGTAGSPSIDVLSVQGVSGGTSLLIGGTTGSFTTRFGSVTTANTAQISTAVTNLSRKYLFVQNVTTSSNVITVGIGFTPTTTQGIQLAAGALIDFESSFIPTGAVYILSSVTGSPFTILEA